MKVVGNKVAARFLPVNEQEDLLTFAEENKDLIQSEFDREGLVLFRGFGPLNSTRFAELAKLFCEDIELEYGDLDSGDGEAGVYQSTAYPRELPIHLHNEAACSPEVPLMLFFHCEEPALQGGATKILDSRKC